MVILNAVYKQDRLEKLTELLSKDPEMTVQQVEEALMEERYSISIYEKIWLLKSQIAYMDLLISSYEGKAGRSKKNQEKLNAYRAAQGRLREALAKQERQFGFLFKKPMSEHYY